MILSKLGFSDRLNDIKLFTTNKSYFPIILFAVNCKIFPKLLVDLYGWYKMQTIITDL